jgi:hypothetical protein
MSNNIHGIGDDSSTVTVSPVAAPAKVALQPVLPEFIRVPTRGLCPWTGISRAKFYELIRSGKIKTVCLRKRGAARGTRLIHLQSLLSYLETQMEGGA